jgi:hypothetical protein
MARQTRIWVVSDYLAGTFDYFARKSDALVRVRAIQDYEYDAHPQLMEVEFTLTRSGVADLLNRLADA